MAIALNLSGLNGLDISRRNLEHVFGNSGANSFTVTSGSPTGLEKNTTLTSAQVAGRISLNGGSWNSANQSFTKAIVITAKSADQTFRTEVGTHENGPLKLIGWNKDGLLFSSARSGDDWFLAAPSGAFNSLGNSAPKNEVFSNNNAETIPSFGGAVVQAAQCFASGTLIGTPSGGVAVEDLRAGDIVVTASGAVRRVKWIGHML